MAIPDFQTLMRPILEVQADGNPRSPTEVRDLVAARLGVTEAERKELLPSGSSRCIRTGSPGPRPTSRRPDC
jgi:restriction system protein